MLGKLLSVVCVFLMPAWVDVAPSFCIRNYNGLALDGPA